MTCSRCGRELEIRTFRPRRGLVLALWALGLGLCWWLAGGLLHDRIEGMEKSLRPGWKLWVPVLALLPAVTATALRLHRPSCPGCGAGVPGGFVEAADGSTRRAILRAGGAAVAASVGGVAAAVGRNAGWIAVGREIFNPQVETSAPNPRPEWGDSRIKGYRRLRR